MTLKYKVGCLIEATIKLDVDVLMHQCNCFNAMGAGIAPLIAKAFPEAEEADNETVAGDIEKLGSYSSGYNEVYVVDIVNLYGQFTTSRVEQSTNYEALRKAIRSYVQSGELDVWGVDASIGLPKIGAGLGGGDWSIISQIIEEELKGYSVIIYVLNESEIPKGGNEV